VHGRELAALVIGMPGLEPADNHVGTDLQPHVIAAVDALQRVQHRLDLGGVADLDEHRRRQLPGPGQERVVDLELVADPVLRDDALSADHLLDLEPHGLPVLEDERQVTADADPAIGLQRDDRLPARLAHLLVLDQIQDLIGGDRSHGSRP